MEITSVAALRDAYPELVAAVEADAATAERERMRAINEIADNIRNDELVNRAMYDEPMTAAELALEAVKADANAGAAVINAIDEDAADAIPPVPAVTETEDALDAEHEAAFTNRVHELYAQAYGMKEVK